MECLLASLLFRPQASQVSERGKTYDVTYPALPGPPSRDIRDLQVVRFTVFQSLENSDVHEQAYANVARRGGATPDIAAGLGRRITAVTEGRGGHWVGCRPCIESTLMRRTALGSRRGRHAFSPSLPFRNTSLALLLISATVRVFAFQFENGSRLPSNPVQ
jgi:hypothetical protein